MLIFSVILVGLLFTAVVGRTLYWGPGQRWSIGIYSGASPLEVASAPGVSNPVLTAKDITDRPAEFVADPFLIREKENWYLFFEVMNGATAKGEIGYATSANGRSWAYQKIVLEESFHLSYPYVFKWDSVYYMIPESCQAGAARLYKATRFPEGWVFVKDLVKGHYADNSLIFFNDYWWLFTYDDQDVALRLFYAEDLLGSWTEHPQSPVVRSNAFSARPGGRLVIWNGKLHRYAQNIKGRYGNSVNVFEIMDLTPTSYKERQVRQAPILAASGVGWNKGGMHHMDPLQITEGQWLASVDGFASDWGLTLHFMKTALKNRLRAHAKKD